MVDKLKKILAIVKNDMGSITLFAIMKMDEYTDKWSVILSASWVDKDTFGYLYKLFNEHLTKEEASSIARIGIFSKESREVQSLLKVNAKYIVNTKVNGFMIHEGYILAPGLKENV